MRRRLSCTLTSRRSSRRSRRNAGFVPSPSFHCCAGTSFSSKKDVLRPMAAQNLEQIVSLCKRRGFIFPGSEIYGGLQGTFDYGPLGLALKKNIEAMWWKHFVDSRDDMFGIDSAILMNPRVWDASGHTTTFNDP